MMKAFGKRPLLLGLFFCAAFVANTPNAFSQTGSFGQAPNGPAPNSQADSTRALVDELNALLEKGERERLIDPWFLRDLQTVIGKYDRPWSDILLQDDFSARGPQPDPPWQVTAGEFLIDWRHGLRSVIEPNATNQSAQSGSQSKDEKDIGKALLGALLQGALQGSQSGNQSGSQGSGTQQQSSGQAQFAAVQAALPISNAFSIDVTFSLRPLVNGTEEGFELGPYQGATASSGYRLSYIAADRSLQLLKVSSRGVSTIDGARLANDLTDGQAHQLNWTRDQDGGMTIHIDGQAVIAVTDRSFRESFDGFAVLNRGGDFAMRDVTIAGVSN
ncbi:hypothetical protein EOI86_16725 [Hwanghaeella grinnelliae]|uniref:DUF1080 domain-containing protein n=1 Tax=Hwanghaeella grinnelliae TaxID=2500179 RepID=A0A437QQL3_9PROT|nr:hypothetical protein [Hwanghaeella grinnelliae]RVU36808.1 hypothetical protein EOI86_16725 [Hwanghaeella grinnelliae]